MRGDRRLSCCAAKRRPLGRRWRGLFELRLRNAGGAMPSGDATSKVDRALVGGNGPMMLVYRRSGGGGDVGSETGGGAGNGRRRRGHSGGESDERDREHPGEASHSIPPLPARLPE